MKKIILIIVLATLCPFLKLRAQNSAQPPTKTISGKVTDEEGQPLPGATVKLKESNNGVITNKDGDFTISHIPITGILIISFIGYQTTEISYDNNRNDLLIIQLKVDANSLNEVQVIGYGTTTKLLNTGSASTISSKELGEQPVTNVLSALSGRAAGVFVQTTNGLAGGDVSIQIRGQNSLRNTPSNNGNIPLYIVDGVPYTSSPLNPADTRLGISSITGAISPFNSLSPSDIESITILKDADATAIYGSRGANGVVLITTKKGKSGAAKIDFNFSEGVNQIANYPKLLDLDQYLQIRREAYANDGITPLPDPTSSSYAPDLTVWSQTKGTDWAKFILGNTAKVTDGQISLSGGDELTQFLIGGNFHAEGTILAGGGEYQRGGIHFSLTHTSKDKKLSFQLSSSYTGDNNSIANPVVSLYADILTPPNFPAYDQSGNLNWSNNVNPLADILAKSQVQTNVFITNAVIGYKIISGLSFKASIGYTKLNDNQTETFPLASQNPSYGVSTANYGKADNQSIIVEPQLNYTRKIQRSTLSVLLGATYQSSQSNNEQIAASNFSNDALIQNASSAATVTVANSYTEYKYESLFGRINYNVNDKYILNLSARRDGSSRFGPGDQFGNFGAAGAAWIFSNESFIKDKINFLSYGKIRTSYGITGNDQIANYQYLSTYGSSGYTYQGISGLQSKQIANADLHWETNKKAEAAIDLGFLKDRILVTVDYYQNRSSNQLISYQLPYLTGFANYQANLPAVIQNKGWEFELSTTNVSSANFAWKTTFNLTLPQNRLLSFPGLAASSYANTLTIGQDINQAFGDKLLNVNPTTGLAQYATIPGTTTINDYYKFGQKSSYFYGGFGNSFTYKNWQLDIFGQFSKQFEMGAIQYSPGITTQNDFVAVLNRWQKVGDIANVPEASTNYDSYYSTSSANWFNASYFRLKNLSVNYVFKGSWLSSMRISRLSLYLQGQNLLTIWNKNDALFDPETGTNIGPMKSWVIGLRASL